MDSESSSSLTVMDKKSRISTISTANPSGLQQYHGPLKIPDECWTTIVLSPRPGKKRKQMHDSLLGGLPTPTRTKVSRRISQSISSEDENLCSSSATRSPSSNLTSVFRQVDACPRYDALSMESLDYFHDYQESRQDAAFTQGLLKALRLGDCQHLKTAYSSDDLLRRNDNGETSLHILCRTCLAGSVGPATLAMARFLMEDIRVPLNVRDSQGKTALHLACAQIGKLLASGGDDESITTSFVPTGFDLLRLLVLKAPELVIFEDYKGNTPLDYVLPEGASSDEKTKSGVFIRFNVFLASLDLKYMAQQTQESISNCLPLHEAKRRRSLICSLDKKASNILESVQLIIRGEQ